MSGTPNPTYPPASLFPEQGMRKLEVLR
jgi:hypothetical protein